MIGLTIDNPGGFNLHDSPLGCPDHDTPILPQISFFAPVEIVIAAG